MVRSTRVMIWLFPPWPMIRSPSQCPGTARSSASAGRSLMVTIPVIRACFGRLLGRTTRRVRPVRNASVNCVVSSPRAWQYKDW